MAWTYGAAPSSSTRDEFRLLIGDTDTTDQIFTDDEVTYFLSKNSSVSLAAAIGCRAAAAKYARKISYSLGDLSEQLAQKVQHFTSLASELEKAGSRYSFTSTTPTVGTVTDSGTQPNTYAVSDEKPADWSLNTDDLPDTVRGIDT